MPEIHYFVARQKELLKIHQILTEKSARRIVILHGMGGIGKTQLAIAYAKRHKTVFSSIFWLNGKDEESLTGSFRRLAKQIVETYPSAIGSAVTNEGKPDEIVNAVKRWLQHPKNTSWLLLYDNYDTPKLPGSNESAEFDIRRYLPEADHGSIIITTRSSQVKYGQKIKLDKLKDIQDSLQILSNTSNRQGVMNGT